MQIVPEAKRQDNVAVFDPGLSELTTALRRVVRARMRGSGQFVRVEAEALALSNEAMGRVLQEELQLLADMKPIVMEVAGRGIRAALRVHSLGGPLEVKRRTFREMRNGPTYVPLETTTDCWSTRHRRGRRRSHRDTPTAPRVRRTTT